MIEPANHLVTVFGGGGFIGRYVCEMLLKRDVRVRVASREPRCAHFIQPLGRVGQVGFVRADLLDRKSVEAAVHGSSAIINLCGVLKGKVRAVHATGAGWIAEAARDQGAEALVHISGIGADPAGEATYARTKGEGEQAVRAAFPRATIIRPSLVFGPEDQITNRFAAMAKLPFTPVIAAERKFQPVYVRDLAEAIARSALEPETYGAKTFEVGGPQVLSMAELHAAVLEVTGQSPEVVQLPDFAASLLSRFGWFPGAPLTRDQWRMLQQDNLPAPGTPGLEAFGIRPTPIGAVAQEWLGRYNHGGRRINLTATS